MNIFQRPAALLIFFYEVVALTPADPAKLSVDTAVEIALIIRSLFDPPKC